MRPYIIRAGIRDVLIPTGIGYAPNNKAREALENIIERGLDKNEQGNCLRPQVVSSLNPQAFAAMTPATFRKNLSAARKNTPKVI